MKNFYKNVTYKGIEYKVENSPYINIQNNIEEIHHDLYIYEKCEDGECKFVDGTYKEIFKWKDYLEEFNKRIFITAQNKNDLCEKLYITLIKELFKKYEEYLETEQMEQLRLEELENWKGVINEQSK